MEFRKSFAVLLGLLLLGLATTAQAAPTFNLNLSNFDSNLSDITGIETINFWGSADLDIASGGSFSEDGTIDLQKYDAGSGLQSFTDKLSFGFTELTGSSTTTDLGGGNSQTTISFDAGQFIYLYYSVGITSTKLAEFSLDAGSGGDVFTFNLGPLGTIVNHQQTYYLTLLNDIEGVFEDSPTNFVAALTVHDFDVDALSQTYTMAGELNAVPVPSSLILIGSGLMGLICLRRRKEQ